MCSDTIVDETKKSRDHSPHSHAKHACVPFVDWRDCTLIKKRIWKLLLQSLLLIKISCVIQSERKYLQFFSPPVVITSKRKMFTKIRRGYRVSAR
jgi:hypothetical protein